MRLRNLFFAVLFCILAPFAAYPAWLYNGTNAYVALATGTATDFPDGDWTVSLWVKLTDNANSSTKYFIGFQSADYPTSGYNDIRYFGESHATTPGQVEADAEDDDGTALAAISSSAPFTGNTNWTRVTVIRSGNTVNVYIGTTSVANATNASFDGITPTGNMYFGADFELGAGRFLNGSTADAAKWNRALTAGELTALSQGFSASCLPGFTWFTPMIGGVYQDVKGGLTVTNNGTVSAAHPRLYSCN